MAKKGRLPLVQAPPPAESSSSEDEETNNQDSSSSDEETQTQSINHLINSQPPVSASESDSDTDSDTPPPTPVSKPVSDPASDTDTDTDSDTDTPLSKSIAAAAAAVSKPKPKPKQPTTASASVTVAALPSKRAADNGEKSGKKPRKEGGQAAVAVAGTPGKVLFQRLFSEEDEIAILRGMIEYKEEKGRDPLADGDDFTRFVEKALHVVDVKRDQVVNKVKRLKKKFETAKKKKKITDPHEMRAFELSKIIWGGEGSGGGGDVNGSVEAKEVRKRKAETVTVAENGEGWRVVKKERKEGKTRAEVEEEVRRWGDGVEWGPVVAAWEYMSDETKKVVEVMMKSRRVRKLEEVVESLDTMRFVTLKAIESLKGSMKRE